MEKISTRIPTASPWQYLHVTTVLLREQANKTAHFKVIADAISDVPNHEIRKVIV